MFIPVGRGHDSADPVSMTGMWVGCGQVSTTSVIARSEATWQSPATAVQLLKLYQEIARR